MTKELFLSEEHMTVTVLITIRLAIASAVLLPALAFTGLLQPIRKADLQWFLLLALCEPFIYHLCETNGVRLVSGSLASVGKYTYYIDSLPSNGTLMDTLQRLACAPNTGITYVNVTYA